MKIKCCQLRPKLGDVSENLSKVIASVEKSKEDIIIFPELFLSGYPAFDNLMYPDIEIELDTAINTLKQFSKGKNQALIVGLPTKREGIWYNSVTVFSDGEIIHRYDKQCLPNYDVFNESRYFSSGHSLPIFDWNGKKIAVFICEDLWVDYVSSSYSKYPLSQCSQTQLDLAIHISASPFESDKLEQRFHVLSQTAKQLNASIVSVNQVGGYNEVLFDGQTMIMNSHGDCIFKGAAFKESEYVINLNSEHEAVSIDKIGMQDIKQAIIFGLQEYCKFSGFKQLLVGVSGGIDSAVVAALAVEACGPEHVTCISLPTKYNSNQTKGDAKQLVENLGCKWLEFPIENFRKDITQGVESLLSTDQLSAITEQNIQARFRGLVLMSVSNQIGALLLTTGNKSELAMGYATLYGDMCGGLNIIGDLFKTDVFKLANYINRKEEIIPNSIITREPSAELAPNQRDSDSLPSYDRLDQILSSYILEKKSLNELVKMNDKEDVMLVLSKLKMNEFKRFQSPPILKLSSRAFGRGWQYPIIR